MGGGFGSRTGGGPRWVLWLMACQTRRGVGGLQCVSMSNGGVSAVCVSMRPPCSENPESREENNMLHSKCEKARFIRKPPCGRRGLFCFSASCRTKDARTRTHSSKPVHTFCESSSWPLVLSEGSGAPLAQTLPKKTVVPGLSAFRHRPSRKLQAAIRQTHTWTEWAVYSWLWVPCGQHPCIHNVAALYMRMNSGAMVLQYQPVRF